MNRRMRALLSLYQLAAGLCDTATGLLLLVLPVFTLRLLGLTVIPQPLAFIRYIGVFVMTVGLTYLLTVARWPLNEHSALVWRAQWTMTALIRTGVAGFVVLQLAVQAVEFGWISVAVTDGLFAAVQITGLKKGWIERGV